eukprot:TRINITY_DN2861_c0_g1_i2.p1 TRINITY_DN2861_c0_g1~~TRINITY_DN2861_c0_g1_i2.p1  ORF type:complete len:401 (-),score=83.74 TRINITY_DN2861_c0_g1_i2:105-1286(-)
MTIVTTLIVVITSIFLWYIFKQPVLKSQNYPHLPTPPYVSVPVLLFTAVRCFLQSKPFLNSLRDKYGDVIHIRIPFWIDLYLFTSGKQASPVFVNKLADPCPTNTAMLRLAMPPEISGKDKTAMIAGSFNDNSYRYYSKMLKSELDLFFKNNWNKPVQEVDFFSELQNMTINTFLRVFLGTDLEGKDLQEAAVAMKYLDLEDRLTHVNILIERNVLPSGKAESQRTYGRVCAIVKKLVDKRLSSNDTRSDFLNHAIKTYTSPDGKVDYDEIVKSGFLAVFAAATNTFATASWASDFIYFNPDVRKKFEEEKKQYIEAVNRGDDLTDALIKGFPFTSNLILETLRNSGSGIFIRKAVGDIDLGQYVMPEGCYMMLPTSQMVKDGDAWKNPSAEQ